MTTRIFDRAFSRLVVDRCVRNGRVPDICTSYGKYFAKLVNNRIIELAKHHPIYPILAQKEWKTSFSISDHTLMWLWNYVSKNEPKSIVEMGSGLSTLVFAMYAKNCETMRPKIISIDHDQSWLQQTRERVEQLGLGGFVDFQLCEIGDQNQSEISESKGYLIDSNMIKSAVGSPDMILIDGPPGSVGRIGTFPSISKAISRRADIFLDDALRPAEQSVVENWVELFEPKLRLHGIYPVGNGLAHLKFFTEKQ